MKTRDVIFVALDRYSAEKAQVEVIQASPQQTLRDIALILYDGEEGFVDDFEDLGDRFIYEGEEETIIISEREEKFLPNVGKLKQSS